MPSKRLPTSAKQRATASDARPASTKAIGLQFPMSAMSSEGSRKIETPMTWFIPMAVRSQRPRARFRVGAGGASFGEEDTAAPLRAACAMGMVLCASIFEALSQFAELLADSHRTARIGAARAVSSLGHPEGVPLVKLKLLCGDTDAGVIGECCSALLRLAPEDGLRLVVPLLEGRSEDVRVEAAIALGESRQPGAFDPLRACWQAQYDHSVRKIVLTAIGILRSDEADEFLLSLIRGTNERDAADAMEALAPFAKAGDLQTKVAAAMRERRK